MFVFKVEHVGCRWKWGFRTQIYISRPPFFIFHTSFRMTGKAIIVSLILISSLIAVGLINIVSRPTELQTPCIDSSMTTKSCSYYNKRNRKIREFLPIKSQSVESSVLNYKDFLIDIKKKKIHHYIKRNSIIREFLPIKSQSVESHILDKNFLIDIQNKRIYWILHQDTS